MATKTKTDTNETGTTENKSRKGFFVPMSKEEWTALKIAGFKAGKAPSQIIGDAYRASSSYARPDDEI